MPGQVTANDILSYRGDSALAGGLGAAGTQQYVTGVTSLGERIMQANQMIVLQDVAKKKQEFDQKMKDREEFAKLLDSEQLQTTDMDDEDRIEKGKLVAQYKDELIQAFKSKGKLDDETYLNLHNKYGQIRDDVIRAKTNYAAMKADLDAQTDPYDKSPGKTTTTTKTTNAGGNGADVSDGTATQTSVSTQEKEPNLRASEENKTGLQKHIEAFKEEKKKNPYAIYKPYVPVMSVKDEDVFLPLATKDEKIVSKDGLRMTVKSKVDINNSFLEYQKAVSDPNKRELLKKKWNNILSSGDYGAAMITAANKKLAEIQAKESPHYGLRVDGTPKGTGYFGPLKMEDGNTATEISVGVEYDGKEVEIPTLVPTLSEKEKKWLLAGNDPRTNTETGKQIMKKAIDHANKRINEGKSPFANDGQPKLEITPQTNFAQGMALLNLAQKYDAANKERQTYSSSNAEKMELKRFETNEAIRADNARTANDMRLSDRNASNQIRVAKEKPATATATRGNTKQLNTNGVYYASGKKQVDMLVSKSDPIVAGSPEYLKLTKKVPADDIVSARVAKWSEATPALKTYFNGRDTRELFVVEHKDGEITFNDTYGNEWNTLDLITVAAGNSKQARQELLGIGSDGEPTDQTPEPAKPAQAPVIQKKSKSGKTVTVNSDGSIKIN